MKQTAIILGAGLMAQLFLMPIIALAGMGINGLDIKAPDGASAPSHSGNGMSLPSYNPLNGPMSDAALGQIMMQVEAEPPIKTRGAGGNKLERLFAARCRSVVFLAHKVKINGKEGTYTGTGSIVSMDGHILTAEHVVSGSKMIAVGIFPSCKPGTQPEYFAAKVIKADSSRDLALLQLIKLPSDIAIMPIGKLDEVRTGSSVVLIGHPHNLFMSLSQGTVSAIRPDYKFTQNRQATVIQTDGALNPGNSGGPMMSDDGNLIGVNSFIKGKASAGLNFAVAVSDVRSFITSKNTRFKPKVKAPVVKQKLVKASCKPKSLKQWKKDKTKFTLFDFYCSGKGDAILAIPDDKTKNPFMALDRNKDKKPDVIIILNRKGQPLRSKWDDDFDGEIDYHGKHVNGEWEPSQRVRL
ncbi:hypothetical protein MNBD_GAMMA22-2082 [hydrothermal vent metagenome]|uniref:Serine protease n=1 Tax=hydrothermal vent metagenome TaxID=652676 RepID=A0A3B1A7G9_9ZZZZ